MKPIEKRRRGIKRAKYIETSLRNCTLELNQAVIRNHIASSLFNDPVYKLKKEMPNYVFISFIPKTKEEINREKRNGR